MTVSRVSSVLGTEGGGLPGIPDKVSPFEQMLCISVAPNLFGTRDWFPGSQFFQGLQKEGWFLDDSSALHLLCTLFIFLFHEVYLRSSSIRL